MEWCWYGNPSYFPPLKGEEKERKIITFHLRGVTMNKEHCMANEKEVRRIRTENFTYFLQYGV